jgi:hypothetical protein
VSFSFKNFKPNKSLPNTLTIILTGVRIAKYTKAITIGAIIIPNISPNLIHELFSGDRIFEFNNPKIKKTAAAVIKYKLRFSPFFNGHTPSIKKTTKNNKPKLLFEL